MDDIEIMRLAPGVTKNVSEPEKTEDNFQKFIYDLFEKNGILNDLRAYLRRHIVDVLKSSNAGDTPVCQKYFSERLEVGTQAVNILVAEYLLRSKFNYTLSVFVSEIPLANMVFDFARTLMTGDTEANLQFENNDVLSIINYLGIKCNSVFVTNILETYKNDKQPLLNCILKCLPISPNKPLHSESGTSSEEVNSNCSSVSFRKKPGKKFSKLSSKCPHNEICRACHNKLIHLKKKNKKKKDVEKIKQTSQELMNVNTLMKNMDVVEGSLVEEMFEQLKLGYEAEMTMMRAEQERCMQRTLQEHQHTMQIQQQEMEEAFKMRSEEMERGVRAKKKFLWGLARSLRAQHDQLGRAMAAVKLHTQRLKLKEKKLKSQLIEVEHMMETRGAEMQARLSSELLALEAQLSTVKRERAAVDQEKTDLEHLRRQITTNYANVDIEEIETVSDNAWLNYDLYKNELSVISKYVETNHEKTIPKTCVVETSTATDNGLVNRTEILNNEQKVKVVLEEDRLKTNQLVNDLKKQKNINLSAGPLEEESSEPACRGASPRARSDELATLRQEIERLRDHARQQETRVQELAARAARLQAELLAARPRSAPAACRQDKPHQDTTLSSTKEVPLREQAGWRCKGAGEETAARACAPRVFLPGEPVPFIGLLRDRPDNKRLMNQWRAARRPSPRRAGRAPPASPAPPAPPDPATSDRPGPSSAPHENSYSEPPISKVHSENEASKHPTEVLVLDSTPGGCWTGPPLSQSADAVSGAGGVRTCSPKSMLREAKQKLRANPVTKCCEPPADATRREKSPASVLREAKLRLRKLEIEAEAVEKSYLDYRRRHSERRAAPAADTTESVISTNNNTFPETCRNKPSYLRELRQKFHFNENRYVNRNITKVKPIPEVFSPDVNYHEGKGETTNYLETPITEFQKFYKNELPTPPAPQQAPHPPADRAPSRADSPQQPCCTLTDSEIKRLEDRKDALIKVKNSKKVELEILKQNIIKMYNAIDKDINRKVEQLSQDLEVTLPSSPQEIENMLMVEVANVNKSPMRLEAEDEDLIVVVENSVDNMAGDVSENMNGNMTIIISPKRSAVMQQAGTQAKSSISPAQAAKLTRNDVLDAIFQPIKVTSADDVGETASDVAGDDEPDYQDNFSADVDNYDLIHSVGSSPISLALSPDDAACWEDSQMSP